MRGKLLIPDSARKDIVQLISLSEDKLNELYNLLDSGDSVKDEFEDLLLQVGEKLDISTKESFDLINVANNLLSQRQIFGIDDGNFIAELKQIISDEKNPSPELVEEIEKKSGIILKLTGNRPTATHYEKVRFLQSGLIDTAESFKSICDIRPVFNEPRSEIVELIPIIIFEVELEKRERRDRQSVVFQLNEESFKKLKDSIEQIENKLSIMKNFIKLRGEEA